MKTLLSLFDESGQWSQPFFDAGWDVIRWDIQIDDFMDINNIDSAETALELFEKVDGILAAVPCTAFAASGARWWKGKDADGTTAQYLEFVYQTMRLVDLFRPTDDEYDGGFFWAIENPVGRIGSLSGLGAAEMFFNPCDYAGWLDLTPKKIARLDRIRAKNGIGVTAREAQFILDCNAYTKKTGLWGEFSTNLQRKPIAPCKGNAFGSPHMRKGGKSEETKRVRSTTPMGFAQAFYEANKDYCCTIEADIYSYIN